MPDRTLSTREFTGERHVLLTFIYTSCETVCPGLTGALRRVQGDAIEEDYADQVAFLPTTFDPAHDTGPVLDSYGDSMGVDDDAGADIVHVDAMDSEEVVADVVEATDAAVVANNGVRDRATVREYLACGADAVSVGRPSDDPDVLAAVRKATHEWFREAAP